MDRNNTLIRKVTVQVPKWMTLEFAAKTVINKADKQKADVAWKHHGIKLVTSPGQTVWEVVQGYEQKRRIQSIVRGVLSWAAAVVLAILFLDKAVLWPVIGFGSLVWLVAAAFASGDVDLFSGVLSIAGEFVAWLVVALLG